MSTTNYEAIGTIGVSKNTAELLACEKKLGEVYCSMITVADRLSFKDKRSAELFRELNKIVRKMLISSIYTAGFMNDYKVI